MENNARFWDAFLSKSENTFDPSDRYLEVMFGVIMALSFTSAVSVSHDGEAQIEHLLWAAISCNIAWGLIDGLTFLISSMVKRSRKNVLYHSIINAQTKEEGMRRAKEELQPFIAGIISDEQMITLYKKVKELPEPPKHFLFNCHETISAINIFLINFFSTLPLALPFIFMANAYYAKIASDSISLIILFYCGYRTAKYSGFKPWLGGIGMVLLAFVFFILTKLLGG